MEKEQILNALKSIKEDSQKRNFKQRVDLIITIMGIDLKKPENKIDLYVQLHHDKGKKTRICGLVGPELLENSKKYFDATVSSDEFSRGLDKKKLKAIARENDFFVAQVNVMPQVATSFGKILGPLGKMPNPKAGCVVTPNSNLSQLAEKLQTTIRINIQKQPLVQTTVGSEDDDPEKVADNILVVYNSLLHALPGEKNNIRAVYLKLTMGKPIKIGTKQEDAPVKQKGKQ
ncbi:50S ribosomal protein L1 [Candidatus Woesearchaeota archaeon]|nr:50S ribosomal protein L1 [Candidatus Woesearchaeota archaeon]